MIGDCRQAGVLLTWLLLLAEAPLEEIKSQQPRTLKRV